MGRRENGDSELNSPEAVLARLRKHTAKKWPQCSDVILRSRGGLLYVSAKTRGGESQALCRLRFVGPGDVWEFGFYSSATEKYEPNLLPTGRHWGRLEECFDTAAAVHLATVEREPEIDFQTFLRLQAAAQCRSTDTDA
jgi:hypothetical protein